MKRFFFILVSAVMISVSVNAMGYDEARREARYLTDKMAYELGLSRSEYDRVYRINLRYLSYINDGSDLYSSAWNARNSALRAMMAHRLYDRYARTDYFYRPVSWRDGRYVYHVYSRYPRPVVVRHGAIPPRHRAVYGYPRHRDRYDGCADYDRYERGMRHSHGRKLGHYRHDNRW